MPHRGARVLVVATVAVVLSGIAASAPATSGARTGPAVTVGPEHPTTDPGSSPAPADQVQPDAAWGPSEFLAVWADARSGHGADVFASRILADGTVLDPAGIAITRDTPAARSPAVAWDGTDFLVVWDTGSYGVPGDVRAARVAPDGTVLDAGGFDVATGAADQASPDVAWNGIDFLIAWQDDRSGTGYDVFAARVASDGTILDPGGIVVSDQPKSQTVPRVASDGSDTLVAWQDARGRTLDVYGARVDPRGRVLDRQGIPIATTAADESTPALGWDGTDYLVAWRSRPTEHRWRIVGARVAADGTVRDPQGIVIAQAPGAFVDHPGVAWDGTDLLVVWRAYDDVAAPIEGARVATDGTVLDATPIVIERQPTFAPAVAWGAGAFLVAMDRTAEASGDDVLVSLVGPDGTVRRSGILVSASAADQQQQAIAGNGSEFLAAWVEIRAGLRFIVAARLASDGTTLDPGGILLTQHHVTNSSPFPAVASDGSGFLVVWEEFGKQGLTDIFGARIAADGTLLDPQPIVVNDAPDYQFVPAVTWNGSSYLVVFGDQRGVRGARVAADGTVLDPAGFQIGPSLGYLPSVVAGSSNALVVWEGSSLDVGVFGARVAPDGTVLDPTPISIGPSTYTRPAVASNGDGFLVAWSGRRGGSSFRVFGNRIDAAGTVLDGRGFVIAGGTTFQAVPALDWDGRTYVVAFERPTNGASIDVLLRRVGADGSLVGRTVPVAAGPDDETGPVGAAGGPGESSVLYLRRATEAPYGGAERAFDRIVTEAA